MVIETAEVGALQGVVAIGASAGGVEALSNVAAVSVSEGNFRCQVGHAWTAEALLGARDSEIEGAMWIAVRSLQEKARLARAMADKAGTGRLVRRYAGIAEEAERALTLLSDRLSTTAQQEGQAG